MKNKFLKAWGSTLLLLLVAFVISIRWASVEVAKALEYLTYAAFLITIPILVLYVHSTCAPKGSHQWRRRER